MERIEPMISIPRRRRRGQVSREPAIFYTRLSMSWIFDEDTNKMCQYIMVWFDVKTRGLGACRLFSEYFGEEVLFSLVTNVNLNSRSLHENFVKATRWVDNKSV